MTGRGAAHGAVTILNATATGTGCSLAVAAGASATWDWTGDGLSVDAEADDRLARAVWTRLGQRGARVTVRAAFPPSRGLKTSSSVAGALVRAAAQASGLGVDDATAAAEAVAASRAAGVTLTGAYDDQVAVLRGGAHLTDNRAQRVVASFAVPAWHVAVWVPAASIPKDKVAGLDPSPLREPLVRLAEGLDAGGLPAAMTENGRLFTRFYAKHGLPVDPRPAEAALAAGALGAGLSGTGPAVAALFDQPAPLPDIPGGLWTWTRAVGAA